MLHFRVSFNQVLSLLMTVFQPVFGLIRVQKRIVGL